jgi:CrcB protein
MSGHDKRKGHGWLARSMEMLSGNHWRHAVLYGYVAAGSVLGGLARYLLSLLITHGGSSFPWATLFVNVTGSFIIGFYNTLSGPDGRWFISAQQRQFVMTGFCGGYTTFSTFSLETVRLFGSGMRQAALVNIALSLVTWFVAVWLGHMLASRLNRLKGS